MEHSHSKNEINKQITDYSRLSAVQGHDQVTYKSLRLVQPGRLLLCSRYTKKTTNSRRSIVSKLVHIVQFRHYKYKWLLKGTIVDVSCTYDFSPLQLQSKNLQFIYSEKLDV
jgi:hypothetical protein